jgi:hypothetical protein
MLRSPSLSAWSLSFLLAAALSAGAEDAAKLPE